LRRRLDAGVHSQLGEDIAHISAACSWEIEAARRALPTVRVLQKPFRMATLLAMMKAFST